MGANPELSMQDQANGRTPICRDYLQQTEKARPGSAVMGIQLGYRHLD